LSDAVVRGRRGVLAHQEEAGVVVWYGAQRCQLPFQDRLGDLLAAANELEVDDVFEAVAQVRVARAQEGAARLTL
jgi:hypothetical protein